MHSCARRVDYRLTTDTANEQVAHRDERETMAVRDEQSHEYERQELDHGATIVAHDICRLVR